MSIEYRTLVDLLSDRADREYGYRYLTAEGEQLMSFGDLHRRARSIGAELAARGLSGERVLLVYPPGLDYVTAFFGCLYAGAVAVPVFPPDPTRLGRTLPRLSAIVADSRPAAALSDSLVLPLMRMLDDERLSGLEWLATDTVPDDFGTDWRGPVAGGADTAFIQYTSGSTATPKGVVLSHANLLHNSRLIQDSFGDTTASRGMSWLPLYHDMGLIGGVLQPLFTDFPITLMSPVDFLVRPMSWLQAISTHRATTTGGPNFAYDLCARKFDPALHGAGLDLSSWRVAFNGAEPVRPETMDRFTEVFGPYGFRREAFLPCYGLAEATLIVTGKRAGEPVRAEAISRTGLAEGRAVPTGPGHAAGDDTVLVSSGAVLGDQRVAVVDPETGRPVPEGTVGEIRVSGPSIGGGYWERPRETAEAFVLDPAGDRWLRTGDLGFLAGGELFVTGRLKDLIIIRGRNVYPQDVEQAAAQAGSELRPGCVIAFGVERGGVEQVVVVGEVARGTDPARCGAVAARIRDAVGSTQDVGVHEVVLVQAGSLPKTSSGKVQRRACKEDYLLGRLERVAPATGSAAGPAAVAVAVQDPGAVRAAAPQLRRAAALGYLRAVLAARGVPDAAETGEEVELARLGMDSLASVELLHHIETALGTELPVRTLLAAMSLGGVADLVVDALEREPGNSAPAPAEPDPVGPLLSAGQRALWFLQQLEPDSRAYRIARTFTVEPGAPLDATALDAALCLLVSRHDALRTAFENRDGEPRPVPAAAPAALLEQLSVPAAELDDTLAALADRRFDLERGELLRAALISASDTGQQVLLLAVHHLAVDLWSLGVLMEELGAAYAALAEGAPVLLPEPRSHAAAVRDEERNLEADRERLQAYWTGRLAGDLPVLELPSLRPRPATATHHGAVRRRAATPEQTARVKAFASEHGATPYLVLLSALQTVLQRYTGVDDVLIGSPSAGRRAAPQARTVGYLLNTIVLRADLSADPTFADLVSQNRESLAEALDHQEYPFSRLVADLGGAPDPSYAPLFQVMLVFERSPAGTALDGLAVDEPGIRLALGPSALTSRPARHRSSTFDLTLRAAEVDGSLVLSWEYNTDVLDAATVDRLADHLLLLLDGVLGAPRLRIGAHALQTAAERSAVERWNATAAPVPTDTAVHEAVLRHAGSSPDAVAVRAGDTVLTYRQLVDSATVVACRLRALGVTAESRVAVYLDSTPEAIAAILGVLLAGGAYVPVDPAAPVERVRYVLTAAEPAAIVTHSALGPGLPEERGIPRLHLDLPEPVADLPELGAERVDPEQLAYQIFTSGSTGHPKGIGVSHANLLASTHARVGYFPDRVHRFLLISSLGFDSSVAGLFWTLYEGGTLVLPDPARSQDPEHHHQLLVQHQVTHFESVPPLYRALLDRLAPGDLPALRSVVVAGEACPAETAARHAALLPGAALVNEYGPTEATVWCSAYRAGTGSDRRQLPIGRPIANTRLHLLDRHGRPTPEGAVGELYVGGVHVTRGYLGQPATTAEVFLPDPFAERPGARMYRTGDLAQLLPDGNLEFVGRRDQQIKIHGVRIELGEVEAALLSCPGIAQAAVRCVTRADGELALAAYLVDDGTAARPGVPELRGHLLGRLLTAMVPAAYAWLPALPLTVHGKLDESRLPDPVFGASGAGSDAQPGDPIAELVSAAFETLLGVPRVGQEDDFFALGGHSLLMTQLVSRIRAAVGVELEARQIYLHSTVGAVTRLVRAALAGGEWTASAPRPVHRTGPVELSHAQNSLWFVHQLAPGAAYNIPVALTVRGPLDAEALRAALRDVVDRHEALRTTFDETADGPRQRVHDTVEPPFEFVDGPGWTDAQVDELLADRARAVFDLAQGPLIRTVLLRTAPERHVLLVVVHHIAADGWSLTVLTEELAAGYAARLDGGAAAALPPLPVQYPDYALWQREQLSPELLDERLGYWRKQLAEPTALRLATDRPRPAVRTDAGATLEWALDAAATEALRGVGRKADGTLYMVLLAAFGLVVGRDGFADDVVLGTPVSGRTHLETEGLIGFFANTLPLRLDLSGNPSFAELVERTRAVCVDAYVHDLPFEVLVERLQPVRDLSRNPLFQVLFALQNAPRPAPRLAGLEVEPVDVTTGTAKFDIGLSVWESGDGLRGTFEFNTDLFDPETVERLGADLGRLLHAVAADPGRTVAELPLHGTDPGADPVSARSGPTGWEGFLRRAADAPDTVAVSCGARTLTRAELVRRVAAAADRPVRPDAFAEASDDGALAELVDRLAQRGNDLGGEGLAAQEGDRVLLDVPYWSDLAVGACLAVLAAGAEAVLPAVSDADGPSAGRPVALRAYVGDVPPVADPDGTGPQTVFLPETPGGIAAGSWTLVPDTGRWTVAPAEAAGLRLLDRFGAPAATGVPGELRAADGGEWRSTGVLARRDGAGRVEWLSLVDAPDEEAERAPHIAPRDVVEQVVALVWADVLGRSGLGVEDDFFELGGHSLLVTRIVTRLGEIFRTRLPVAALFERPTVAAVAELLRQSAAKPGQAVKIAEIWLRVKGIPAVGTGNEGDSAHGAH